MAGSQNLHQPHQGSIAQHTILKSAYSYCIEREKILSNISTTSVKRYLNLRPLTSKINDDVSLFSQKI